MSDKPDPSGQTINIPTRMPNFVEDKDNTSYANLINVSVDSGECCLTFLRRPRPLSLDLQALKSGEVHLEVTAVSRVYLSLDAARGLCQALANNLAVLDSKGRASGNGQ